MDADLNQTESRTSGGRAYLSAVHAGIASRWCRRFRAAALASAVVFALINTIPFQALIDEYLLGFLGLPLLGMAIAASMAVTLVSGCLYFLLLIILQVMAQRQLRLRDKKSEAISRSYLYLRSFRLTRSSILDRAVGLFDPRLSNGSPFTSVAYKQHDPEEEIAQAVAPTGLLIAIGDKRRSYGAAKVHTPDATWQSEFFELADSAELIFVSPALTEGSRWELHKLFERDDYMAKSVFVMPRNWYADEWDDLRKDCSRIFAVELPEYDAAGAYFVTKRAGKLEWCVNPETFIRTLNQNPTRELLNVKSSPAQQPIYAGK